MSMIIGGPTPQDGLSAYQIAVANGFIGSEAAWLASLQGEDGLTPTFTSGTITTLAAGSNATGSVTGSAPNFVLNFGLPRGADGTDGDDGSDVDLDSLGEMLGWSKDSGVSSATISQFEGKYARIGSIVVISLLIENSTSSCNFNLPCKMAKGIIALEVGRNGMTLTSTSPLHRVVMTCAADSHVAMLTSTTPGFLTRINLAYLTADE